MLGRTPMISLVPLILFASAVVVLAVGLPFSSRFHRRGRYISGIILVAFSLAGFWPVQTMFSERASRWSVYGIVAFLPALASLFVFASGVGLISKANNKPRDDYYEGLF
jgi:hypothetical protein